MWTIKCVATGIYAGACMPGRGELVICNNERHAQQFDNEGRAKVTARVLKALYGSFDWQLVPVKS